MQWWIKMNMGGLAYKAKMRVKIREDVDMRLNPIQWDNYLNQLLNDLVTRVKLRS